MKNVVGAAGPGEGAGLDDDDVAADVDVDAATRTDPPVGIDAGGKRRAEFAFGALRPTKDREGRVRRTALARLRIGGRIESADSVARKNDTGQA